MNLSKILHEKLLSIYSDEGIERGGFITDEIIECENHHINKLENFTFSFEDLDRIESQEVVTLFHTHPNGTSTLTQGDFRAFINYPQYLHLIVGKNGISCYKVTESETVVIEEIVVDEN